MTLTFGAYVLPDAAVAALRPRWREAVAAGFGQLWLADHTQDFRNPGGPWFDAASTLTAMALETEDVRIGTLVANPVLRPPAVLAHLVASLDHLSGGRFELGIGTGIAGFDHQATGTPYWPIGERLARFGEYLAIVDELLRSAPDPVSFRGRYYETGGMGVSPPTPQRPRPPIVLGGQSPTVLRLVAERGDAWNTHGPFGASVDEILQVTKKQQARLDGLCEAQGRDPGAVRRSLLLFDALDAWADQDAFERIVTSFAGIGFTEFVVFWPSDGQRAFFEHAVTEVMPTLR